MRKLHHLLLILLLFGRPAWADPVPEYEMKATFLYNFALFTEWPNIAGDTFNLCILGRDNFGAALKKIEGKPIAGRPINIARLSSLAAIKHCHLLFVTDQQSGNMGRILSELADSPVLTVSEAPCTQTPAITLVIDGNRLAFDVNLQRTRSASLNISSKLLKLARSTGQP